MSCIRSVGVISGGAYRQDVAVGGERNRKAGLISACLAIKVGTELQPLRALPVIDANVAGTIPVTVVPVGANRHAVAVGGQGD